MFHILIIPVEELARPKLPHAVTQTALESPYKSRLSVVDKRSLTLTEPNGARSLPLLFPLAASVKPKLYFPNFFPSIVHERANVSSECAVRISSQSFALEEEYEREDMGGNLREAMGMDRDVAFFARDPMIRHQTAMTWGSNKKHLATFRMISSLSQLTYILGCDLLKLSGVVFHQCHSIG